MLKTRMLTALVLVPLVLAALFLLPPRGLGVAILLVIVIAAREWARLSALRRRRALVFIAGIVVIEGGAALPARGAFRARLAGITVVAVCGAAALFWLVVAPPWVIAPLADAARRLRMMLVGLVVLVGAWVALVELQARSPWLVLAAMAIVWIADTAAYFSGRAFGRSKLAPQVSPGKTWEGVYGAWLAVALYALCLLPFARDAGFAVPVDAVTVAAWLAFVLLVVRLGGRRPVRVAAEAPCRRQGQRRVLPGHGGVLDRTDALLAAMPIAALAAQVFLVKA